MFRLTKPSYKLTILVLMIIMKMSIDLNRSGADADFISDVVDNTSNEDFDQRRIQEFKKLRHFLLTSNAEELAKRRELQNQIKRQLVCLKFE